MGVTLVVGRFSLMRVVGWIDDTGGLVHGHDMMKWEVEEVLRDAVSLPVSFGCART